MDSDSHCLGGHVTFGNAVVKRNNATRRCAAARVRGARTPPVDELDWDDLRLFAVLARAGSDASARSRPDPRRKSGPNPPRPAGRVPSPRVHELPGRQPSTPTPTVCGGSWRRTEGAAGGPPLPKKPALLRLPRRGSDGRGRSPTPRLHPARHAPQGALTGAHGASRGASSHLARGARLGLAGWSATIRRIMPRLMEVLQLLISGVSQGCVYGLIALGFVLIYKATEMVNFAQGDIMMLGAFVAFSLGNLAGAAVCGGVRADARHHGGARHGARTGPAAAHDRGAAVCRADAHDWTGLRHPRHCGSDLGQSATGTRLALRRGGGGAARSHHWLREHCHSPSAPRSCACCCTSSSASRASASPCRRRRRTSLRRSMSAFR